MIQITKGCPLAKKINNSNLLNFECLLQMLLIIKMISFFSFLKNIHISLLKKTPNIFHNIDSIKLNYEISLFYNFALAYSNHIVPDLWHINFMIIWFMY